MSNMHLIEKQLSNLPEYVDEFITHRSISSSENTLLEYTRDYKIFFEWLTAEHFYDGKPKDVPLSVLESLKLKDVSSFQMYCSKYRKNSNDTIVRRIVSLKALFHYLSQIAEDDDFYPYLKRNVMAKVEVKRTNRTESEKAERIQSKILVREEIDEFRSFVASGYLETVRDNKRLTNYYMKNRERDTALISLILGSGLRVSEAVSIDLDMIDWNNGHVLIERKGAKLDKVVFSTLALQDLMDYKEIRESRYGVDKSEKALFLTLPSGNGVSSRMTKNTAQKMVDKYAEAFGKGALSIHKLRHTFATQHYQVNKDINTLKRQLGHSNINTTSIYTHVFDDTLKDSVDKADN